MTPTPELDKLIAMQADTQTVGEFLNWMLNEQGWTICKAREVDYYPICKSIDDILAMYHGIDMDKVEKERRTLLEEIRKPNTAVV